MPSRLPLSLLLICSFSIPALSACFEGGTMHGRSGDEKDPTSGDPGDSKQPGDPGSSELFSCGDIDDELQQNCDISDSCSGFSTDEHSCISDLMSMDWFRPPCEEYAECLEIPLFDCADTEAELSHNCGIDEPTCAQMEWNQRFCLSALMSIDWSQPPCEQYAECLEMTVFSCSDINSEISINCEMEPTCNQWSFEDRLCVSDLMNQLWDQPPCDLYQACVQ